MVKPSAVIVAALLAGGCAIGNTHTFDYVPTTQSDVGKGVSVLLLAVDDQRPYVLSGDEPAEFVGEQRGEWGLPFNVTTSDKRPFAQVVQETIRRDLESAGFGVSLSSEKAADVSSAVRQADAGRALKVIMRELKSDTYININYDYDIEVIVYDQAGNEVARNKLAGEDVLPGSFLNPPRAAKQKVPQELYKTIQRLVTGDEKIVQALTR